jgi:hypothetical protein
MAEILHMSVDENVSHGSARRISVHAVVAVPVTRQELEGLARDIAAQHRDGDGYQALVVFFYDYPHHINLGATLGQWRHVPYGEWARAGDVALGDYTAFQEVSEIKDKDWAQRPTAEEVDIWHEWHEHLRSLDRGPADTENHEPEAFDHVAARRGLDLETVGAAVRKGAFWMFADQ